MVDEKRKHQRVSTLNLFSYVCLDENDAPIGEGMGRTLDISLGGLLIETRDRIEAKYILLLAVSFENELIDIKCEVVYSRRAESTMFESGVRFLQTDDRMPSIVEGLVKTFNQNSGSVGSL